MSRPSLTAACALLLLAVVATPALARSRVVASRTSNASTGALSLANYLLTGHRYRLDVMARHRSSFSGYALQHYTYVVHGRLGVGDKSLSISGTTPRSFSLTQPVSVKLSQWVLELNLQSRPGTHLTLHLVDLGR